MIVELQCLSSSQKMNSHFQNPMLDALYCEEGRFGEDWEDGLEFKEPEIREFDDIHRRGFLLESDLCWEDEEIVTLLSKEKKQGHLGYNDVNSDGLLKMARNEAITWMMKVIAHHGFAALTGVLAVNYFDRFITTNLCFQTDKPWMSQLAAVACLSIAAKVEETQVPHLLDFQVEDCKYVFEAKTIQRMELLVLSTLQWRMNPVTPISFLDHLVRRFELLNNLHWEFLRRCESVLLAIVADADCRLVDYLPSSITAATMKYVIREIEPCDAVECEDLFLGALQASEGIIEDCHKIIIEIVNDSKLSHKRKHETTPSSPSGVIDAYFSSDSSSESWSITPSPEPMLKRKRSRGS